jgi:hypothetical protein
MAIDLFYCRAQVPEYFDADLSSVLHCGPLARLPPLMLQPLSLQDGLLKLLRRELSRTLDPSGHHPGLYRVQYSAIVHNESAPLHL